METGDFRADGDSAEYRCSDEPGNEKYSGGSRGKCAGGAGSSAGGDGKAGKAIPVRFWYYPGSGKRDYSDL